MDDRRRCAEKGCGVYLSRFNTADFCWQHRKTVRGGPPVSGVSLGCGTPAGYRRHLRRGERPCHNCADAGSRAANARRYTKG